MEQRLRDRVCLVTGGTRGIGKGIARRLLTEGARVWICGLHEETLAASLNELGELGEIGGSVTDVGSREQVEEMVAAALTRWGRIDALVANTGIGLPQPFLEITDETWERVLTTNLRGTFFCGQVVARQMVVQGGGGAIVNIASTNGLRGQPRFAAYGASKGGIINLSLTMALELGVHGIRTNVVCPGTIWTETSEVVGWEDEVWAGLRAHTALNRLGTPEDVAGAVAYLLSDDAAWVTGHVMVVDGGLTARQTLTLHDRTALTPASLPTSLHRREKLPSSPNPRRGES